MNALDQVKKYKELARSMGDFLLIMLSALIAILFLYIGFDLYQGYGGQLPSNVILSGVELLLSVFIFGAGLIVGLLWTDHRVRRVKVGEWKALEGQGTLGAMKILSSLDWPNVFQDIRYSKVGFVFYSVLKIAGYWILAFVVVELATGIGLSFLHVQLNIIYVGVLSLIVVLLLSRNDLQRRYNQAWALDSLLWELRWFDSEFRGKTEFGAARATTTKA